MPRSPVPFRSTGPPWGPRWSLRGKPRSNQGLVSPSLTLAPLPWTSLSRSEKQRPWHQGFQGETPRWSPSSASDAEQRGPAPWQAAKDS
jgi:hypothetical protein